MNLVFLTNRFDLPALTIVAIYKQLNLFWKTSISQMVTDALLNFDDHQSDNQLSLFQNLPGSRDLTTKYILSFNMNIYGQLTDIN